MNISEKFFTGYDEGAEHFENRLKELYAMCKRIVYTLGLDADDADDLFQETAFTLWRGSNHECDEGEPWQAYVWGIASNLAYKILRSRGLLPKTWARTALYSSFGFEETEADLSLEKLTSDGAKSSEEAFALLEEQIKYDEWQIAYAESFINILNAEIQEVSSDPFFPRFVEIILEENIEERAAWRLLVCSEIERVLSDQTLKEFCAEINDSGRDEKELWLKMVSLSLTNLKSFPTYNRYYKKLKEAVQTKWQEVKLPFPGALDLGGINDPQQKRWKQAALRLTTRKEPTSVKSGSLESKKMKGIVERS